MFARMSMECLASDGCDARASAATHRARKRYTTTVASLSSMSSSLLSSVMSTREGENGALFFKHGIYYTSRAREIES